MPKEMKELQQQRSKLAMDMRALHETIGDDAWTGDQRQNWENMRSSLEQLDEQVKREEELRSLDQRFVDNQDDDAHRSAANGGQQDERRGTEIRAFDALLRNGLQDMDPELRSVVMEMRAQAAGTGDKGGYTVPTEFRNTVIEKMKSYGGIASIAQVIDTDGGNTIEWATTDGTAEEGELIGENSSATEGDVTFGTASLGAKKLSSKIIRVSGELLSDSGVNIEALLTSRIAMRLYRGEAKLLVQGTGTGTPTQPKGLAASATTSQAAAAAAAIGYTDLLRLKHKIDPAYRAGPSVRYAFNDTTFLALKELEDGNGRPLWKPDVAGVAPATIDGDQFIIDSAIADIAASATSVFYGDFNRFILRRVRYMALKRLVERYAEFDQVGFIAFHRFDCVLEDTAAIAKLAHPAT